MVPAITQTGTSFKGAAAYYLNDKDADTKDRIAWTHVENLATNDPEKAWKIMAFTATHQGDIKHQAGITASGRKMQKPVFAFSLAWHPDEKPDQQHMLETAKSAVKALGLQDHQAVYVAHNDEPQQHVHVMINRVHPENGKAAVLSKSKQKLSAWALNYEQKHGIRCKGRVENAEARESGRKPRSSRYSDPVIQNAWHHSDTGTAFESALKADDYQLAQGRKRVVIVDRWGKSHNPTRHLDGVNARQMQKRLSDVDLSRLPDADKLAREVKKRIRREYHASREFDSWATKLLNDTQDRQLSERANLHDTHHRKLQEKERELKNFYKFREKEKEIADLKAEIEKRGLINRVTGKQGQMEEQLQGLEKSLRNGRQRYDEQMSTLRKQRDDALERQREVHEKERILAHELIRKKRPEFYRDEPEQDREPNQSTARKRDRGQGRGREREM